MMKKSFTIMIIDDEEEFLNQTTEMLNLTGYRTISTRSGREALERMKSAVPHVVLLDLNLKEGPDGFDIARNIKEDPILNKTSIIIISGMLDDRNKKILEDYIGVDLCLEKPVRPAMLINCIENILVTM